MAYLNQDPHEALQESQSVIPPQEKARPTFKQLGLTIYDSLETRPELILSQTDLEKTLREKLKGLLLNQPIRTRSKVVKTAICNALGYPVPKSFLKSKPRFPGQNFDVYNQKSNNLQIWNEELSAGRRYVLVRVNEDDIVTTVRVITGSQLEKLDTTGTLTRKYQATAIDEVTESRLVSKKDTPDLQLAISERKTGFYRKLLPVDELFEKLKPLIGKTIEDPGADQERNRGWALHELVSQQLGLAKAEDDGQVPDVAPQLLELKLQTSPTVDLGLISPGSPDQLEGYPGLKFADIRYAIFYGTKVEHRIEVAGKTEMEGRIRLDQVVVTTGADFFCFFKRLERNVVNKKNQIRLPKDFFEEPQSSQKSHRQ